MDALVGVSAILKLPLLVAGIRRVDLHANLAAVDITAM